MATEWDGVTKRDVYREPLVAERDRLADAAKAGRWPDVLALVRAHSWANRTRLGGASAFTALHQAAWHGAAEDVVRELVDLGAWRTIRATNRQRPIDIAEERGHRHLRDILKPAPKHPLPETVCTGMEEQLHLLIRGRIPKLYWESELRLPQVEPITELDETTLWFPVPGLYGGFNIELSGHELTVQSWNRVHGGWAQTHRVTEDTIQLVESGWDI
ncbi:MAG TPA: hypothetical protein VGN81_21085 [Pseudonocardiaceae bacterium]|jgi:hypothetical protein